MHVCVLAAMAGFFLLGRYLQLVQLAEIGYGPYTTIPSIAGFSVMAVLIDLPVLWLALRGSQSDKIASLAVPALFAGLAAFIFFANNL